MSTAMLRREGRRLLPLMNPKPAGAVRSGLLSDYGGGCAVRQMAMVAAAQFDRVWWEPAILDELWREGRKLKLK
ncbi:hypothetical protein QJS04_geneDACA006957 [Acorus gramineus]|uniref:Uncharacterized protein n=1 Tax=Acorus gramineus TaxID=55184 RepID=A0AAV9AVE5_ACOGR|nr:hypothetical protein QJS04_geneDACA006957 [Acorus gramineus]